jgi:hypothetical protein
LLIADVVGAQPVPLDGVNRRQVMANQKHKEAVCGSFLEAGDFQLRSNGD